MNWPNELMKQAGTVERYMKVRSAMSCEYENGRGCDRILVQPWYAWLICSRCSSRAASAAARSLLLPRERRHAHLHPAEDGERPPPRRRAERVLLLRREEVVAERREVLREADVLHHQREEDAAVPPELLTSASMPSPSAEGAMRAAGA